MLLGMDVCIGTLGVISFVYGSLSGAQFSPLEAGVLGTPGPNPVLTVCLLRVKSAFTLPPPDSM